jgi:uncharacterized protein
MLCPIDQTELVMTERKGVEIDYCPKCRGVWLDRGELDKIIERANDASGTSDADESAGSAAGSAARGSFTTPRVGNMQGRVQQLDAEGDPEELITTQVADESDEDPYDWEQKKHKRTKRRSFFEELFDFD